MRPLRETEVLATSGHGSVQSLAEVFVGFVFRKVELCGKVSFRTERVQKGVDLRLKQVWLDGKRSLLP